jgi:hypothetical protein
MSCPICSGMVWLSTEEPRKQLPCPNCGSTKMPVGVSEADWIKSVVAQKSDRVFPEGLGEKINPNIPDSKFIS